MKKLLQIISLTFILFFFPSLMNLNGVYAQNTWTQKANFPGGARFFAVAFSIGNKGYVGLGSDGISQDFKDFWEYDPVLDTWTQKADFPSVAGRVAAVGFSIGNKGYVGTGSDTTVVNDFWEYDPALDTWIQKASIGFVGREFAVGFSIGNKGYIGTGYCLDFPGTNLKDFWEYNPATDIWIQKADFGGMERSQASCFSVGGKGYVGLGSLDLPGQDAYNNELWEYDTLTDVWTQKTSLPAYRRQGAVGFSIGDKGYFGTGYIGWIVNQDLRDFWEYNPSTNAWVQAADFGGTARFVGVGFNINGKGYLGTGSTYNSTIFDDLWEYTSDTTLFVNNYSNVNNSFIAYPNPNAGVFSILSNQSITNSLKIQIFNTIGDKIIEIEKLINEKVFFDFSEKPDGMYLIVFNNGIETVTQKIIINH